MSEYDNSEQLETFTAKVDEEADALYVDRDEVAAWSDDNPTEYTDPDAFPEFYGDPHPTDEEPHNSYIRTLAQEGPDGIGDHGDVSAMGVPRTELPTWDDLAFALEAGADYVILDGRGGGTGAAPDVFKDNISVPTIPAIARAREYLDETGNEDVTLIATGGLRTESDFVKAMALGADGVAVANSAMQAIGCLGMRACDSNNCPVGIATQKEGLRNRLVVDQAASGLENFFAATTKLMQVLARACGYDSLQQFQRTDLTSWKRDVADLAGVEYAGAGRRPSARSRFGESTATDSDYCESLPPT